MPTFREAGVKTTGTTPVPLSCAVCGEVAALSLTVSVPDSAPSTVGVNVTEMLQLASDAKVCGEMGHFEVAAKSPDAEILLMVSGDDCVLVNFTVRVPLVVSTIQFPNPRLLGFKVWAGALRAIEQNVTASSADIATNL